MPDLALLQQVAKSDETVVDVTIRDRSGAPYLAKDGTPATIGVVGSESKTYKDRKTKADRAAAKSGANVTMDELRRSYAVGGVVRWHGWEDGAKELECSADNVRVVLSLDHILHQVEAGIRRDADFLGSPSAD